MQASNVTGGDQRGAKAAPPACGAVRAACQRMIQRRRSRPWAMVRHRFDKRPAWPVLARVSRRIAPRSSLRRTPTAITTHRLPVSDGGSGRDAALRWGLQSAGSVRSRRSPCGDRFFDLASAGALSFLPALIVRAERRHFAQRDRDRSAKIRSATAHFDRGRVEPAARLRRSGFPRGPRETGEIRPLRPPGRGCDGFRGPLAAIPALRPMNPEGIDCLPPRCRFRGPNGRRGETSRNCRLRGSGGGA